MSDDYQSIPVAVARAAVQASGELEGVEGPLFLAPEDGAEWEPWFLKRDGDESCHPLFAKVTVTRKGQKPREVVISWDEYAEQMDADPAWDAIRASKPMAVFGGEAERHAYRVVFADVLAALEPEPRRADDRPAAGWDVIPGRDWIAEVQGTAGAVALNALFDEAKAAGALAKVEGLQQAFMDRTLELGLLEPKPKPSPRPQGQAPKRRRKR